MKINGGKKHNVLYQVFGIVLLAIATIVLVFNSTVAWFRDSSTTSNGSPNIKIIGTIALDVTTNFNFYNLTLQPDTIYLTDKSGADIGTYLNTNNKSVTGQDQADKHNIDGCLVRIKFTSKFNRLKGADGFTPREFTNLTLYFTNTPLDASTSATTFSEGAHLNKWLYDGEYYYYLGILDKTTVTFNNGYKIDNKLTNDISNEPIDLEFTVEAIQRQYGAHEEMWDDSPALFKSFANSTTNANPNRYPNGQ